MINQGPDITLMMHHLRECPFEFLMEPRIGKNGVVETTALCRDILRNICADTVSEAGEVEVRLETENREYLLAVQTGCWFFSHSWFKGKNELIPDIVQFFREVLSEVAPHVVPEEWTRDMERCEEFCRLALSSCSLAPFGESESQAQDRFESVSTLKRKNILSKTAAAYRRMKKIREQMAEQAAREAANVYGRE